MSRNSNILLGIHAVEAALDYDPGNLSEVMVDPEVRNPRVKPLVDKAREFGIAVHSRPKKALDQLAGTDRHQGIAAFYKAPDALNEADLERIVDEAEMPLLLILDGVQDPHNFGACLRSAAAAKVTAVVIPKDKAVGVTPTVRRASAGAADRVPIARITNLARTLRMLKDKGVWLTGAVAEAERSLYQTDLRGSTGIVIGGEGEGLRRLTRETCDTLASIPMPGQFESLNVSVATGIFLFEAVRQRIEIPI